MFLTIISAFSSKVLAGNNELQDLELLINPLELNRLFTSIHHERMQQKALLLKPGAHSHEGFESAPAPRPATPARASAPVPAPAPSFGPAPGQGPVLGPAPGSFPTNLPSNSPINEPVSSIQSDSRQLDSGPAPTRKYLLLI